MSKAYSLFEHADMALQAVNADPFFKSSAAKARPGLATTAPFVGALLSVSSPREEAMAKALSPDIALFIDTSGERMVKLMFESFEYDEAVALSESGDSIINEIPSDHSAVLLAWGAGDGSILLGYSGNYRMATMGILNSANFTISVETHQRMSSLWTRKQVPWTEGGMAIASRMEEFMSRGIPVVPLSKDEAEAFVTGFVSNEKLASENDAWRKSVSIKATSNGATVNPSDFEALFSKLLAGPSEELRKVVQKRFDEIRKERERAGKVYWRDVMCDFLKERGSELNPVWDCGLSAFMMSKPSMFQQSTPKIWKETFCRVADIVRVLPEGESPELAVVAEAASPLGQDIASGMAHFMYRFHRQGGPKTMAKKIVEELKVKVADEMKTKTGLAAIIKKDSGQSEEAKELTKAALSVEFAVQYGAALAMCVARWGVSQEFVNPAMQAKVFVKGMRGTDEISLECLGWFARLMVHFSDGRVPKEMIEKLIIAEMDSSSANVEEQKSKGGKLSLENEWSGKWSSGLARRKIREYLGITMDVSKQGTPAQPRD